MDRSQTSRVDSTNGMTTGTASNRVPICHRMYREIAARRLRDAIGWFHMNLNVFSIHASLARRRELCVTCEYAEAMPRAASVTV